METGMRALAHSLSAIHDPQRDIVWASRAVSPAIVRYVDALAASGVDPVCWTTQWNVAHGLHDAHWLHLPGRDAFNDDLHLLATVFSELISSPSVKMRVDVTTQRNCPRFHVDNVQARLLCTYRGPGTEYLEGRCAQRSRLGPGSGGLSDEHSGLILDAAGIHSMPTLAVAVLKGKRWPDGRSPGAIHRSPAMRSGTGARVMVAIDFP
jgi:hypothetical protein